MSTSERIAVVSGVRTPFARARTAFQKMTPSNLAGVVLRETVSRSGIDPKLIDEVYMGIVSAPAEGSNIAREGLFDSGLPPSIPSTTINFYCGSSMEATSAVASKISSGQINIGLAGGVESISSVRALFSLKATDYFQDLAKAKTMGQRLGLLSQFKASYLAPNAPGITEPTLGLSMGQSADLMSRKFNVGRKEQDEFALASHVNASKAWDQGFYQTHVCKVATPDGKVIERDTDVRSDSSIEKLSKLRPVFYKDGTITAGNASPLTDGASCVLLMKESRAKELGMKPLGFIRSYATAAVDIQNEPLLIAPAYAFPVALKRAGLTFDQIDLFEIHEAFAGQVLSTIRKLELDGVGKVPAEKLNLKGGSISIGHPFGATGGRMILQTLHGLKAANKQTGLISVCTAGGMGCVMILEAN